jgi:uncharacterized damage-inducible protein DinB
MEKNRMLIALMDEYKRAIVDYNEILFNISQEDFVEVYGEKSKDPDCKSIQMITFHIIQSGYTYANYIQSVINNHWLEYNKEVNTTQLAIQEINKMVEYTEQSFHENWFKSNKDLEKYSFKTRWNVTYDLEQFLEHAIVHILRHRRQIENFLKKD